MSLCKKKTFFHGPKIWVWSASYAPTGLAKCKLCKELIAKGAPRLSRDIPNNWTGDSGMATGHYHLAHGLDAVMASRCQMRNDPYTAGDKTVVLTPPPIFINVNLRGAELATTKRKFASIKKAWIVKCK